MDTIDQMKQYREILRRLQEAAGDADPVDPLQQTDPNLEPASTPDSEPEAGSIDQTETDKEIEDVMTEPRSDTSSDILAAISDDLEIADAQAFTDAFSQLKNGAMPLEDDEHKAFADAFISLMKVDASTAQRAINRLRSAYKK